MRAGSSYYKSQVQANWLTPHLRPALDKSVAATPGAEKIAYGGLVRNYELLYSDEVKAKYNKALTNSLNGETTLSQSKITAIVENALRVAYGPGYKHNLSDQPPAVDGLMLAVVASSAPDANKNAILRWLAWEDLANDIPEIRKAAWYLGWNAGVAQVILERHIVDQPQTILKRLKSDAAFAKDTYNLMRFTTLRDEMEKFLSAEADRLSSTEQIYEFMDLLSQQPFLEMKYQKDSQDQWQDKEKLQRSEAQSSAMIEVKSHILAAAARLSLSFDERLKFFLAITETGNSQATDDYFANHLFVEMKKQGRLQDLKTYAGFTADIRKEVKARIKGSDIRLEIAKMAIQAQVQRVAIPVSSRELNHLLNQLDLMVPESSLAKDDFLETLGLQLRVKPPDVDTMIEARKVAGVANRGVPFTMEKYAGLSEMIASMEVDSRKEFILYLRDPESRNKGLPPELLNKMKKQIVARQLEKARLDQGQEFIEAEVDWEFYKLKESIESNIRRLQPLERIPIFDLLLMSGKKALKKDAEAMDWVVGSALGYTKGSESQKALHAFLKIIPPDEEPTTLAYLLALEGKGGQDEVELFKVFTAVGVQFGQLMNIFKLVREETSVQLAKLKDKAPPLALSEIHHVAEKELSAADFNRIAEFEEILGAGSVKTVVKVRLKTGEPGVLYLINPYAAGQIDANLELGEKLIGSLAEEGIRSDSPLFRLLVEALKSRMKRELNLVLETQNTELIRQSTENFKRSEPTALEGLDLQVAAPFEGATIQPGAMLYQYFSGQSFESLREQGARAQGSQQPAILADLKRVGRVIFKSSLYSLFRDGVFDPDRHAGNILVDRSKQPNPLVRFIDYGKLEDFRGTTNGVDDRFIIAQFFYALGNNDSELLVRALSSMSSKAVSDADRALLQIDIAPLLNELRKASAREFGKVAHDEAAFKDAIDSGVPNPKTTSDILLQILSLSVKHGVQFEYKFLLGAIKGLLVLVGEHYVSTAEGFALISEEVERTFKQNPMEYVKMRGGSIFRSWFPHATPASTAPPTLERTSEGRISKSGRACVDLLRGFHQKSASK